MENKGREGRSLNPSGRQRGTGMEGKMIFFLASQVLQPRSEALLHFPHLKNRSPLSGSTAPFFAGKRCSAGRRRADGRRDWVGGDGCGPTPTEDAKMVAWAFATPVHLSALHSACKLPLSSKGPAGLPPGTPLLGPAAGRDGSREA